MPRGSQANDLEFTSVQFGKLNRALITLSTSAQEHRLIQPFRESLSQHFGQVNDWGTDHPTVKMVEFRGVGCECLDNFGMIVTDEAGHLARGPVHDLFSGSGPEVHARGLGDDVREEVGTEGKAISPCIFVEDGIVS